MATSKDFARRVEAALRAYALGYPEAYEEFPWGERALKVKRKVFVFLFADAGRLSVTVKLPESNEFALMFDYTEPTGYGLGKSGWVTARVTAGARAPLELLKDWIDESYRAVAPKALVARIAPAVQKKKPMTKAQPPRRTRGTRKAAAAGS
jgi:predicted DNA-binding protein (MmcQ/YjbR family)